ncbi:MAG TPA: hypothetical protein H9764_03560 [Candidatus Flavonifractor merdavium]|nr:hypothetical protein [Candidatus Flavonifractor merdavium]
MQENFDIAGNWRISVDDALDQKNISIGNQKAIIDDFVTQKFPGSTLTFYEDRDRSGCTTMEAFANILKKDHLERNDLELSARHHHPDCKTASEQGVPCQCYQ